MSWLTSRSHTFGAAALLAAASFLGLTACETTGDLTVDLPNPDSSSSAFLDLPVSAATVLLDPALTLKTDRFLVGRLRDQVTGLTEATGVLNLRPSTVVDSLPGHITASSANVTQLRLDSVVLVAPFEQVYGTATAPLRYDVLPLTTKLDERVVYTADSTFSADPAIATNLSAPLNATRQTTQTASDGSGAVITTTVPDLVVRQVLQGSADQPKPLFTSVFEKLKASTFSQADLDAVLPGIALAPSAGYEGSIVGFGRGTVGAQLRFSFSYDSAQTAPLPVVRKKRSYSLFFGPGQGGTGVAAPQDPRYFTQLKTDRSGSALAALSNPSQAVPAAALDGRSYLQAGIGLGTRITFGDLTQLETLRNTPGIAINRAELRVPVQPFTTGLFPYPLSFYALEVDASNKVLVRTANGVQTERVRQAESGDPNNILVNSGTTNPYYNFVITNYLQAYLTPNGLGTGPSGEALPAALVLTPTLRSGVTVAVSSTQSVTSLPLTLNRAVVDATNIHLRVYYSQLR